MLPVFLALSTQGSISSPLPYCSAWKLSLKSVPAFRALLAKLLAFHPAFLELGYNLGLDLDRYVKLRILAGAHIGSFLRICS